MLFIFTLPLDNCVFYCLGDVGVREDLNIELVKFKIVAQQQAAVEKSAHKKAMMLYRLELLKARFAEYDKQDLDLDQARARERAWWEKIGQANHVVAAWWQKRVKQGK